MRPLYANFSGINCFIVNRNTANAMPSNFVHVHTKQMLILSLNCRQEGVGRARFFFFHCSAFGFCFHSDLFSSARRDGWLLPPLIKNYKPRYMLINIRKWYIKLQKKFLDIDKHEIVGNVFLYLDKITWRNYNVMPHLCGNLGTINDDATFVWKICYL